MPSFSASAFAARACFLYIFIVKKEKETMRYEQLKKKIIQRTTAFFLFKLSTLNFQQIIDILSAQR